MNQHKKGVDHLLAKFGDCGGFAMRVNAGAAVLAAGFIVCSSGCGKVPEETARPPAVGPATPRMAALPNHPKISVAAEPVSATSVKFVVTTNMPTPIQVMAGVDLAGQKDDDVYIGYTERVTLTGPITTFVLDGNKARKPLPTGNYEARVNFYPRWGAAGNPAAEGAPEMSDVATIRLSASGLARESAEGRNHKQVWLMEHVIPGMPWNAAKFVAELGRYQKSKATLSHLHDAYYFPAADMTVIVNRPKSEVTVWRKGEALD